MVDSVLQEKVGISPASSSDTTGKGKSNMSKQLTHGYHLVEGKSGHAMEDYVFAEFRRVDDNELGLFAIFDGHLSRDIPNYLKSHLFNNILKEVIDQLRSLLCSFPLKKYWMIVIKCDCLLIVYVAGLLECYGCCYQESLPDNRYHHPRQGQGSRKRRLDSCHCHTHQLPEARGC